VVEVSDNSTFSLASGLRGVLTVGNLVDLLLVPPIGMKDGGGALATMGVLVTMGTLTTGRGTGLGGVTTGAGLDGAGSVL
jgi:hypothetical protein